MKKKLKTLPIFIQLSLKVESLIVKRLMINLQIKKYIEFIILKR